MPRVDILGMHPSWQTLLTRAVVLLAVVEAFVFDVSSAPAATVSSDVDHKALPRDMFAAAIAAAQPALCLAPHLPPRPKGRTHGLNGLAPRRARSSSTPLRIGHRRRRDAAAPTRRRG